eukprot:scaffold23365_cov115-Isochrysis_galbana.AAC.7
MQVAENFAPDPDNGRGVRRGRRAKRGRNYTHVFAALTSLFGIENRTSSAHRQQSSRQPEQQPGQYVR